EGAELAADARADDAAERVGHRDRAAVVAEQMRHPHREAGVAHPTGEAGDVRIDARHLAHDDYRRTAAGDIDPARLAAQGQVAAVEILEGVGLVEVGFGRRHAGGPSTDHGPPGAPWDLWSAARERGLRRAPAKRRSRAALQETTCV